MIRLLALSLVLAGCSSNGPKPPTGGTALLRWQLPSTFTHGDPLRVQDIDSVMVYGLNPQQEVIRLPGFTQVYVLRGLPPGQNCYTVTVVVDQMESDEPQMVCKFIR